MEIIIKEELNHIISKAKIINYENMKQHIPEFILKPPFVNEVNIVDIEYIYRAKCFPK